MKFLQVLVMALSFVLAVGANLGIGACVLRYKEMRTPTNLCLVNLAAADLLFALGVPAVAYTRLTQSWRLGEAVCRMLPYSQVSHYLTHVRFFQTFVKYLNFSWLINYHQVPNIDS